MSDNVTPAQLREDARGRGSVSALTYVELFAGAGGLSHGLDRAGWHCLAHAEIEPHARAVLRHRWPDTPLFGDVSTLDGTQFQGVTLLSGGSPCQDLSVAGKRAGLSGRRSGLFFHQVRLWHESQATYCLWENVVGALSSREGKDFARVLSNFLGEPVAVPRDGKRRRGKWSKAGSLVGSTGVRVAWRVIDLRGYAVPQRRRRVFVLAARAGGCNPAEVLLELAGDGGHRAAGGEAWEANSGAAGVGAGSGDGGEVGACFPIDMRNATRTSDQDPHLIAATFQFSGDIGARSISKFDEHTPTLRTTTGSEGGITVVTFDARGNGDGGAVAAVGFSTTNSVAYVHPVMPTLPHLTGLNCPGAQMIGVMQSVAVNVSDGTARLDADMGALGTRSGGQEVGAQTRGVVMSLDAECNPGIEQLGPLNTGSASGGGRPTAVVTFDARGNSGGKGYLGAEGERFTLGTTQDQFVSAPPVNVVTFSQQRIDEYAVGKDEASTIAARDHKGATDLVVSHAGPLPYHPRRLMPVECERLMSWEDGWTATGIDEQGREYALSDTARYKLCGNGVASVVSAWIGLRLRNAIEAAQ